MEANSWRLCRSRSIWEEGSGPNGQRRAILSGNIRRGRYSCSVDRTGKDSNHGGRTAPEGSAWATGHAGPAWPEREAVWPRRVSVAWMWEPVHTNGAGGEGRGPRGQLLGVSRGPRSTPGPEKRGHHGETPRSVTATSQNAEKGGPKPSPHCASHFHVLALRPG